MAASVFVSKDDPFLLLEVERLAEPVPDPDPSTRNARGEPGRWLDIRYRRLNSEDEWSHTTKGHLTRKYRALSGQEAKNLISPLERAGQEEEVAVWPEDEPEEPVSEEPEEKPKKAERRGLFERKAKAG